MSSFRTVLLALLAAIVLAISAPSAIPANPVYGAEIPVVPLVQEPVRRPYEILGTAGNAALHEHLEEMTHRAWRRLEVAAGGMDWQGVATIVWCASAAEYVRHTGHRAENTAAAASPSRMTVWINPVAFRQNGSARNLETMTHELGHLLVGQMPGGRDLPLWANEGLVMHLAGQRSSLDTVRLGEALWANRLPSLHQLEDVFPRGTPEIDHAYSVGYFAIRQLALEQGDRPGHATRLAQLLADPIEGPRFSATLREPLVLAMLDQAVRTQLGDSAYHGAIILLSGSSFWLIIIAVVAFAWWKARQRRAEYAREAAAEDEAWRSSLTEADVQDIYGDKEDRWD